MSDLEYFIDLRKRLEALPHGERGELIKLAADTLGKSQMTVRRGLKKAGFDSGRKKRSDRGTSSISDDSLRQIAALVRSSERANDKSLMPIKVAIEVAFENGKIDEIYSAATVSSLMTARGLHPRQMKRATPHVNLKSNHPNHLWQLDPSICVLYYLEDGESMMAMDKNKFYKNKMDNLYKIANERVFRYVVTDHASGAFYCKYYLARGENKEVLFDFLMSAMGAKDKQKNPFEGVPKMMYWDKGTANTSHIIKNLMDGLGVDHSAHQRGNSRAKGQVEQTNNIIEKHFEGRLYLLRVRGIDQLNEHCEAWMRDFQSNEKYAHSRHKMPRFTAWRKITEDQLVFRPPLEVCKMLLTSKDEEREVKGNYQISYQSRKYNVSEVNNVRVGEKIRVTVNPYKFPSIFVSCENEFGEDVRYEIAPLEVDEYGFTSDSIEIDGHHQQAKLTNIDKNRQDIDELAFGTRDEQEIDKLRNKKGAVAFGGTIDPIGYLAKKDEENTMLKIPKKGKARTVEIQQVEKINNAYIPKTVDSERIEQSLPVISFIKWFAANHEITPEINAKIRKNYSDGAKESEYESIADSLLHAPVLEVINK